MGRKKHTPEQIIQKLREAEIALAQTPSVEKDARPGPHLRNDARSG
jgi:hypothetical protein